MDSLGVIEDEIVHKLPVEYVRLFEQEGMVINKFLLDCSIEPLKVRVHLRRFGVGVEMGEMDAPEFFGKMLLELRAIVGQDEKKSVRMRKCFLAQREKLGGRQRGMTLRTPSEREPRIDVFEGDHIPPAAVYESFHRIEGNEVPRILRRKVLRFSQYFLTIHLFHLAQMRNFLREHSESSEIVNEVADGARFWANEMPRRAEWHKQRIEFLSAKVRMRLAQPSDFPDDRLVPKTNSFFLGRS